MRSLLLVCVAACGSSGKPMMMPDDSSTTGNEAVDVPGDPMAGAHALAFSRLQSGNPDPIASPAMDTQDANSTMIVSVGRGRFSAFALPTDNKGNSPYKKLGTEHTYTKYPSSGTGLYAFSGMAGGSGHIVRASTPTDDEITIAAVEVKNGTTIRAFEWNEALAAPLTSKSVTTTGPATLVAFWWGDHDESQQKVATPDNGFAVVDSIGMSGALVQCFVAVKNVSAAGTYNVTWTATPLQGAQLWLVAVE